MGRKSPDTIKAYEYGLILPSLEAFLSLAGSLGISPNDLCRMSSDDNLEYVSAKAWAQAPTEPLLMRIPTT